MMKKNIFATVCAITLACGFNATSIAKPIKKIPSVRFTLKNSDCYKAPTECLLVITPSKWAENKERIYNIEKICDNNDLSLLYNYSLSLKDQVDERKFLGQKICKGIVTISDMSLPFPKPDPNHHITNDGNDGFLLLETAKNSMQDINNLLHQMQDLATKASTGTYDPEQLSNINQTFQNLLAEVSRVAQVTSFNHVHLLDRRFNIINIPTHKNIYTDFISVSLPDLTTGTTGLNIADLTTNNQDNIQTALSSIKKSISTTEAAIQNIDFWLTRVKQAADADATITTFNLNGSQFVIHQEAATLKS